MKVMLTGGTGFLGSYIARCAVDRGFEIVVLARNPDCRGYLEDVDPQQTIRVVGLAPDFSNIERVMREQLPDVVIHIAARSRGEELEADIREYIHTNVLFGSLLMQAMRAHAIGAFVNSGTSWQSGDNGAYTPFNFYAATKQSFEDIVRYYTTIGMRAITLRVFDTFGPHDRRKKVLDLLIDATKNDTSLAMSPGEQKIDLVDVRDAAEAFVIAAMRVSASPPCCNEIYGVTSGAPISLREVAQIVARLTGFEPNIRWGGRPYRLREIMTPCATLSRLPGWTPRRTLEDGVRDIISTTRAASLRIGAQIRDAKERV